MKLFIFAGFVLGLSLSALGQGDVEAAMKAMEGRDSQGAQEIPNDYADRPLYQPKNEIEAAVMARAEIYWNSTLKGYWRNVYPLYFSGFKKAMSEDGYMNRKHPVISGYHIREIEVLSEECVVVHTSVSLNHSQFAISGLNSKRYWYKENGDWFLVADPFSNQMNIAFPGREIELPCSE